jgi:capsule biosynthesis phosphatase
MGHEKRIVVDFDDTLCITKNRDFENASPKKEVIEKINCFYNSGFEVVVQTARGQVSCDGNVMEADRKYRVQIENWLSKNGVNYTYLTFNKILAQYYIDDKAINPEDFSKLDIVENKSGLSGATVFLSGDKVFKTHKNTPNEIFWYNTVGSMGKPFNIPKIYSVVSSTITMQRIYEKSIGKYQKMVDSFPVIVDSLKFFKGINICNSDWDSYVNRVKKHAENNGLKLGILEELKSIKFNMVNAASLNHGDLNIENIIVSREEEIFFIDSIFNSDLYSSYLIDLAKICYSCRLNGLAEHLEKFYDLCESEFNVDKKILKILEVSHWYRVLTYTEEKEKYTLIIKNLERDIKDN